MFEKIVLRRSADGPALSLGELAESLLYYQNVHLVLDHGSLNNFIAGIGMDKLLALLTRPNVSAVYCEETLGTSTTRIGVTDHHSFVAFTVAGSQQAGHSNSRQKRLEFILQRHGYDKQKARKLAERFRQRVPIRKLTDDYYTPGGVIKAAMDDLRDPGFIHKAIRRVLSSSAGVPTPLEDFRFEVIATDNGFFIFNNLNFEAINASRRVLTPTLDQLTNAALINEILMARADIAMAAHYGGDFYSSETASQIVRLRHSELLRRMGIDSEEVRQFKEIVLPDMPSIREVINSGERSFDDFLALLDKSERFRGWIKNVNPDEKLVQAYLSEVTSDGWINKTPGKILRYVLTSAVGFVGPITGLVISAADSFLIEKVLGGWRPSHFVDRKLKPFLGESV